MNYDKKTELIINNYKKKIKNEKIKQINLLKEKKIIENSVFLIASDCELDKIKKIKKQISTRKANITKFKKIIRKIAGPIINTCPYGILDIIFNNLYFNKNEEDNLYYRTHFKDYKNIMFNKLIATSTLFWHYFRDNYKIIQFAYFGSNNNYSIYIKNNIFHNIDVEQLLYIPLTKEGRTFIHLLVRNNKLGILKKLVEKFSNLNTNIGTTKENWSPFHNATWFNYNELVVFLTKHGINNKLIVEINEKKQNIIDWIYLISKKHGSRFNEELYNTTIQTNMINNYNKYKKQTVPQFKCLLENESLIQSLKYIYTYLDNNMLMIRRFDIISPN
jgi:hypothetical protein